MARYSMFGMAGIGVAGAIGFVFMLGSLGNTLPQDPTDGFGGPGIFDNTTGVTPLVIAASQELKKFTSVSELQNFLLNIELNRGAIASALEENMRAPMLVGGREGG
ncbi:MAG: hypothetical protein MN733_43020, partial [Nitrososphaera sp.]|nr:hypothetical protein [Nitrososphaera sp.]